MKITQNILYAAAWIQALIGTVGSLFFSEVLGYPPCILCWYQRIALYPLVLILAVAILKNDKKAYQYVLPLTLTGTLISLYQNLLYYKLIPENIQPCQAGISCTTKYIEWFGFITIPLLALLAFIFIDVLMIVAWKITNKNQQ